jgi:hypothetical protein
MRIPKHIKDLIFPSKKYCHQNCSFIISRMRISMASLLQHELAITIPPRTKNRTVMNRRDWQGLKWLNSDVELIPEYSEENGDH